MPAYLGIDESNHGRYPEIFVAVFSDRSRFVHRSYTEKKRRFTIETALKANLPKILGRKSFMQAILTEEQVARNGYKAAQAHAIAALIHYFGNLDRIIIDGAIPKNTIGAVLSEIPESMHAAVTCEAYADTIYPLVNKADEIANILFHQCQRLGRQEYERMHALTILPLELRVSVLT
jgi:hypothetical protein